MDRIIVDDSFTQQMPGAIVPCLVFNSKGKRIGYFTPEVDSTVYQGVEPSVNEEELDRREHTGGGRSLTEILDGLDQVKK